MSTMEPNSRVTVYVASPSTLDARDDGQVNLRVEDEASGMVLVDLTMDAGRWWRLCQGTVQHHDAFVTRHPERIGMKLETRVIQLDDALKGDTERDVRRDVYHAADRLAPDFTDFQEHTVRRTNSGREAVLRRWVKP